jgi:Holliday junction DNA helicase RuvA
MIAGLRGRIVGVEPASVVITTGPIDVRVGIPTRMALRLVAGQELDLRTYLHVRENQLALFGFATRDELELFELLLTVSGVGPKAALNILSVLDATEIRQAITDEDPRTLARAPGVGLRVATRIVNDLQNKVPPPEADRATSGPGTHGEAIAALIAMGYAAAEAKKAVDRVANEESVEAVLRDALGILAEHSRA